MATGNITDYARHRKSLGLSGGTDEAVHAAMKSGRISRTVDGVLDFEVADQEWELNTRRRVDFHADVEPVETAEKSSPVTDWAAHKARREAAEASLRELELSKRSGALVDRAGVERAAIAMSKTLRDTLLDTLPSKISLELAAMADPWQIECKLRESIRAELHAIVGDHAGA